MEYLNLTQIAEKWGTSRFRVRQLCSLGQIPGVILKGHRYMVPANTKIPQYLWSKGINGERYVVSRKKADMFPSVDKKKDLLKRIESSESSEDAAKAREDFLEEFGHDCLLYDADSMRNATREATSDPAHGATREATSDPTPTAYATADANAYATAAGFADAFAFTEEAARSNMTLTKAGIRQINRLLLQNPDEKYRNRPYKSEEISFAEKVSALLETDFVRRKTMHPLERTAILYLEFLDIDPFSRGTVATGMLVVNLQLRLCGYPDFFIKYADCERYYGALEAWRKDNDPSEMLTLLRDCLEKRLDERIGAIFKM